MQNLGFFIYPFAIAGLKVGFGSYEYSQFFMVGSTIASIVFAVLANNEHKKRNAKNDGKMVYAKGVNDNLELQMLKFNQKFSK